MTTIIGNPNQREKAVHETFTSAPKSDKKQADSGSLSSMLRNAFGEMKLINSTDCVRCHNLKKDLYQTLNVLQRFETTSFSDYVFRTLLMTLHMVKNIMEKACTIEEKDKLFESFYDLFKGISLYAQNSVKSDRQFTQSLDYNIRIYQTPVKLNAFYNAYIYNLKEYLNSMENDDGNYYSLLQDFPSGRAAGRNSGRILEGTGKSSRSSFTEKDGTAEKQGLYTEQVSGHIRKRNRKNGRRTGKIRGI